MKALEIEDKVVPGELIRIWDPLATGDNAYKREGLLVARVVEDTGTIIKACVEWPIRCAEVLLLKRSKVRTMSEGELGKFQRTRDIRVWGST